MQQNLRALLIIGPEYNMPANIKALFNARQDCLIIGDGETPIDIPTIRQLLRDKNFQITEHTRIDIAAHGNIHENQHVIQTDDGHVVTYDFLEGISDTPIYTHLWSCHSGSCDKEIQKLKNNSILVTHIEYNNISYLTNYILYASLKRYLENTNITPHQQFILDLQENVASTFNQKINDEVKRFQSTRFQKVETINTIVNQLDKGYEQFAKDFLASEIEKFNKLFSTSDLNSNALLNNIDGKLLLSKIFIHSCGISDTIDPLLFNKFIDKILDHGIDINTSLDGMTPLHMACDRNNNLFILETLIKKGANINASNKDNATPLHIASLEGNADAVEILIQNRADVHLLTVDGASALLVASQAGNAKIVSMLIEAGADLNTQLISDRTTPLVFAAQKGHIEVVQELIAAGAKPDSKRADGVTPLMLAAKNGHIEIVQQLITEGANPDLATTDGLTPLMLAAKNGHIEIVQQLITEGANPDLATTDGLTPLMLAAENGHTKVVQQLKIAVSNVNAIDDAGHTPKDLMEPDPSTILGDCCEMENGSVQVNV